jgi:hypothetical protein
LALGFCYRAGLRNPQLTSLASAGIVQASGILFSIPRNTLSRARPTSIERNGSLVNTIIMNTLRGYIVTPSL